MSRHQPQPRLAGRLAPGTLAGLGALVAVLAAPAGAQEQPVSDAPLPYAVPSELDVYEGRPVRDIVVGRPDAEAEGGLAPLDPKDDGLARNQLRMTVGAPFSVRVVSEDIDRLDGIGRFARIDTRVQLMNDGTVVLYYILIPQPIIQDVQTVGNRSISDQDLSDRIQLVVGTPIDRYALDRAIRQIQELYKEKGYHRAKVTVDEEQLAETGIVLFRITEGPRTKVVDIRFEGNRAFTASELRPQIKTKKAWLLEKGPLDDEVLDQDVARLVEFYRDRGYLDVEADRLPPRISPDGKEAIVTYVIKEGPVYTLRNVQAFYPETARRFASREAAEAAAEPDDHIVVLGRDEVQLYKMGVFTPEQIAGLLDIKPGDVYSLNKIRRSIEILNAAYGKMGFTEVNIQRFDRRDSDRPQVDLFFMIVEGPRYLTGQIAIQGNDITKQQVILREIKVRPDRPLDTTEVARSEILLRQKNLFETNPAAPTGVKATIQRPDPAEPDHRDVLIEVTETNTGSVNFGAAVDSDAGIRGAISLEQRNFDLFDTPDTPGELFSGRAFRGAGQTLRIEALPGDEVETYQLSLSDPWLFESRYSGSATLFYNERDYSEYDERRWGLRMSLGRRFGELWVGTLNLRAESVNIYNIENDAPVDYYEVEGQSGLTSAGITFTRSTLDSQLRPSRGSRTELGVAQFGVFGGDYNFTSLHAEHVVYLTVYRDFFDRRTILSLRGAANYIPQGPDEAPVFERFYLGGRSFRGFDFRGISPRSVDLQGNPVDDPVGGTWSVFFGAELEQPLWQETLSGVIFVDSGTVTDDPGFEEYRVAVGFGFRVFFPALSPAPLAFDFGFPIYAQDGDEERLFTFSVDLPF